MWSGQEQHPVSAAQTQEGEEVLLVRAGGTALQEREAKRSWLGVPGGSCWQREIKNGKRQRLEERGKEK